jgi:HPt (histidine-containing phosphotransfer) domain-containing protein
VTKDNLTIDQVLIDDYLDNLGKTVVAKMLSMYEVQSKIYLSDIEQAIEVGEQSLWQERCHKMKGASGSVGMKKVHAYLVAIEKSSAPLSEKNDFVAELKSLNEEAIDAFTRLMNN